MYDNYAYNIKNEIHIYIINNKLYLKIKLVKKNMIYFLALELHWIDMKWELNNGDQNRPQEGDMNEVGQLRALSLHIIIN